MKSLALVVILLMTGMGAFAQTEGARISGRVTDPTDAVIVGAECKITNLETNASITTTTNQDGIYVISDLRPATYRLTIQKPGFRTVVQPNLQLYVQDAVNLNFQLTLGSTSESITVEGGGSGLQTDSAAVSTVVDQQFVANMPLNGRSFQSLIALAPGIVFISQDLGVGQFIVNGQRSDANYFMVDGVSGNFGATPQFFINQTTGGTIPGWTSAGGTNGLVSVDAMQEFRIQTSSYAPEFGRGPGAQISIVTKSGTNRFHGTAFDYLRNDIFDARNWFNTTPAPKPPLRQNDFGGTLGGPIVGDRTFFFFSYEGLRLRQPQTATDLFYTASARAAAAPSYQPFMNALPLPTAAPTDPTCDNITKPCVAPITAAFSNPFSLDATSIRIDHNLTGKVTLFARYNHAPSRSAARSWEEVTYDDANTDTVTAGASIPLTPTKVNDFRANWSRNTGSSNTLLMNFYGAVVPPTSVLFPPPYGPAKGQALVYFPDGNGTMEVRDHPQFVNVQRQLNFVDTFAWTVGVHQLKFGIDYRRLNPSVPADTGWGVFPSAYTSIVAGTADVAFLTARDPLALKMSNYSLFAQATWKTTGKLTLTYGLRWEKNTPPASATSGQPLYAVQGIFDSNPLAMEPGALWHTGFGNFAPRFGAAYQFTPKTVVRGGFGLFYDLGYGSMGGALGVFPYERYSLAFGVPFDLTSQALQPPPFSTSIAVAVATGNSFYAFDPNLQRPFTMQWNAAIERELGAKQTLTATYVGSDGRRLLRGDNIVPPQFVNGGHIFATRNAGYSHYNALQVQFQRRMSRGLQALVSYNFAKSSDLASSDDQVVTAASISQVVLPALTPSDFDIRHSISGAVSYEIPAPAWGRVGNAILKGWAVDGLLRISSAPPLNVQVGATSHALGFYVTQPDIVPGQPDWIADPAEPGGKALNPDAFAIPAPGITGNSPRNGLRNIYSLDQADLALRRRFNLTERVKLDVRVEYFNVFNHPMFGAPGATSGPDTFWGSGPTALPSFGKVTPGDTMNVAMGGVSGLTTGQSALYAVGGPRSGQFTLKLTF
ncbi:MAG TPA: TonB-dependent receptor [Terriglobales bacterium]|nr:TonB-dependent receptor [Terriglobales bacterium]